MIDGELLMTLGWSCYYHVSDTLFKKVAFAIEHCLESTQSFVTQLLLKMNQGVMEIRIRYFTEANSK